MVPVSVSPAAESTIEPGTSAPSRAGSFTTAQASSSGAGTRRWWVRSMGDILPCGHPRPGGHRPIGRALSFDHDERVVVRDALDGHHLAVPPGTDAVSLSRTLAGFHDEFLATGRIAPTVRPVVADSWRRSLVGGLDPETSGVRVALGSAALEELRRRSPLARTMPVIRRLLVDAAADAGLVVAVSDAAGQLLWVEGDAGLRTRAEGMQFVAGADWSEASAGTNAPGTALRTGRGVQILGPEHLVRLVTPWSCTAVPIRDPDTRSVLGALDVTGGPEAAGAQTLALVRATVAAAEAQLRIDRLRGPAPSRTATRLVTPARLAVLGRPAALLERGGRQIVLSLRHSEIVLLLSEHRGGLRGGELEAGLSASGLSAVTVRAEVSRLRSVLGEHALRVAPVHAARGGQHRPAPRPQRRWKPAGSARPSPRTRVPSYRPPRLPGWSSCGRTSGCCCANG